MKAAKIFPVCLLICTLSPVLRPQTSEQKEADRHYDKWLNQDVLYIITDDERAVFTKLRTSEEKDQFIEQFWQRRDPNPGRLQAAGTSTPPSKPGARRVSSPSGSPITTASSACSPRTSP